MSKQIQQQTLSTDWHAEPADKAVGALQTSTKTGLSEKEVENRRKEFGFNNLPQAKKRSVLKRFFDQFNNVLIYVLIASACITAFLQHTLDTVVIIAVVLVNALIGLVQEGKAEKALDAIRNMLAPSATVIRDGIQLQVDGKELVPGDIVLLEAGNKVPADLRLYEIKGLIVQEAILTGESVPVEKQTKPVGSKTAIGDRSSMAYSGTLVTSGQGKGIVVGTASNTELGRISGLLAEVSTLNTPLLQQMSIFAKWVTAMILLVAALILLYGFFILHHPFNELFMAVVSLSVAAIPEGLPAVLTITLAIGVQAMAKRHTIVRRLPAIETLGSVSVICTDKTGTLTKNEMIVKTLIAGGQVFTVAGNNSDLKGDITLNDQRIDINNYASIKDLARTATLCNNASILDDEEKWSFTGDPMEGALLSFATKSGINIEHERQQWPRTDMIPFDAKHRFMATLNHNHLEHACIYVKGAPEQILSMCNTERTGSEEEQGLQTEYWKKLIADTANQGQRVLAFAMKKVPPQQTVLQFKDVTSDLVFLGLAGFIDPPRKEAQHAVRECYNAGIEVKMITGDHANTAMAIGRQIGLINPDNVLTGQDLDELDDETLAKKVVSVNIFARTSPEHKIRLVTALQTHGLSVAMTGDGVNDAPALKRADAGIAMGQKGSEVTKEAAELVLTDDNFASIVAAVREGRTVYDNLKKVISWTLPTSTGEALTIITALLLGLTLPVTPIQILWINLITVSTLGMTLAFEPTEANTMNRPPRPRNEPLLSGFLAWQTVLVSILFLIGVFGIYYYAIEHGYSIDLARSMAMNTLVVLEIFQLFFIRNIYSTSLNFQAVKGTKVIWSAIIIITCAQFAITYIPFLQTIFTTQSIPLFDGFLIFAVGVVFFATVEIEKQIRLKLLKHSFSTKKMS